MDYRISLVGLLIGFLIGLTGMGGGSLLAPIMILFFRIPPVWAVSTDIAYSTVTKAVGSIVHIRQKHVDFGVALWLVGVGVAGVAGVVTSPGSGSRPSWSGGISSSASTWSTLGAGCAGHARLRTVL